MVMLACDWYRQRVLYGTVLFAGHMAGSHDPMAIAITERAPGWSQGVDSSGQGSHIDVRFADRFTAVFACPARPHRPAGRPPPLRHGRACGHDRSGAVCATYREPGAVDRSCGDTLGRTVC